MVSHFSKGFHTHATNAQKPVKDEMQNKDDSAGRREGRARREKSGATETGEFVRRTRMRTRIGRLLKMTTEATRTF